MHAYLKAALERVWGLRAPPILRGSQGKETREKWGSPSQPQNPKDKSWPQKGQSLDAVHLKMVPLKPDGG